MEKTDWTVLRMHGRNRKNKNARKKDKGMSTQIRPSWYNHNCQRKDQEKNQRKEQKNDRKTGKKLED